MGLEEIENLGSDIINLRRDIKILLKAREVNVNEALISISDFKARYDILVKENGEKYCAENYSDIIININKLANEFRRYHL